jgi:hypothetical protein
MIWIIIITLLLAFLLWLLLGPVILFLNTETNRYHLALPGIIKIAVVPSTELFHIRGWVFFIPFKYHPFRPRKGKRKEKPEKPKAKKKPRKVSGNINMVIDVVRSLRIRKLYLNLDTDDFILNAWLVPAFSYVNSENIRMRVNFEGTSSLLLDLRLRLGTLIWIFIRNKYKSFINL